MVTHNLYLVVVNMVVVAAEEVAQPNSAVESAGKLKGKLELNKLQLQIMLQEQMKKRFLRSKTILLKNTSRLLRWTEFHAKKESEKDEIDELDVVEAIKENYQGTQNYLNIDEHYISRF